VCGTETWALAEMDMNRLGTWDGKILRRLHGQAGAQGIYRIRTDQELRELYKDLDIAAGIKMKRLEWIGHVVRMVQGKTVKKIFGSKLDGSRRRGRHR
jgi:hypothetical protein